MLPWGRTILPHFHCLPMFCHSRSPTPFLQNPPDLPTTNSGWPPGSRFSVLLALRNSGRPPPPLRFVGGSLLLHGWRLHPLRGRDACSWTGPVGGAMVHRIDQVPFVGAGLVVAAPNATRGQSAGSASRSFPIAFRSMAELLSICEVAWWSEMVRVGGGRRRVSI